MINREIKKSKKEFYAKYFAENIKNTKKIWEGIRKIVNITKTSSKPSQLEIGGRIIDDDGDLATNFNNFFNVFLRIEVFCFFLLNAQKRSISSTKPLSLFQVCFQYLKF